MNIFILGCKVMEENGNNMIKERPLKGDSMEEAREAGESPPFLLESEGPPGEWWAIGLAGKVSTGGSSLSHTINMSLKTKVNVIYALCHRPVTDYSQVQAPCFAERLQNSRTKSK